MSIISARQVLEEIRKMERGLFSINHDEALTREVEELIEINKKNGKYEEVIFTQEDIRFFTESDFHIQEQCNNLASRANTNIVPNNIPLRFIKRIINRLIKVFSQQQVDFNNLIIINIKNLLNRINAVFNITVKSLKISEHYFLDLEEKNRALDKRLTLMKAEFERMYADFEKTNSKFGKTYAEHEQCHKNDEERISKIDEERISQIDNVSESIHDFQEVVYMINSKMDSHLNMFTLLRDELFYELEHKVKNLGFTQDKKEPQSFIKESFEIKTRENGGKIKLNLGSGPFDVKGYVNVDFRNLPNVDIISDVTKLPFEEGQVDEIFTSHLLEHFPLMQLKKDILPYWRNLLKTDGKITIIVPDIAEMAKVFAGGGMEFNDLARVIMGAQEYDGNYHYAVFSEQSVCELLEEAGFAEIEVIASKRKNDICLEMEIIGYKK